MPTESGINPKFNTILIFGLICMCKKIKAGEGSVRMSFRTRKVTRSLSEPRAFLRESPVCKKLTPKLFQIWPKKLPHHVGAMSWHHAKYHDLRACFGFTVIKKPSFSIFSAEPRRPDV